MRALLRGSGLFLFVFLFSAVAASDLSITVSGPATATAGTNISYTISVSNGGPDSTTSISWTDVLPAGETFVSLTKPSTYTCTTPAVGANGTVSCSYSAGPCGPVFAAASCAASVFASARTSGPHPLGAGGSSFVGADVFTLTVGLSGGTGGTTVSNTATVTTPSDPNPSNNSSTASTTVAAAVTGIPAVTPFSFALLALALGAAGLWRLRTA